MRGCLVPLIYRKTLLLDSSEAGHAAALTLVTIDIERITNGIVGMHEIWADVVEMGLAIWLLQKQVGAACAVPIGIAAGL